MAVNSEDFLHEDDFDAVLEIIDAELLQNNEEFEEQTQSVLKTYFQRVFGRAIEQKVSTNGRK